MALATRRLFRFGRYRLDADQRLLVRDSERVSLRPRVFDTLVVLVEHCGEVVSKEELLDAVWPDTVVEENNLNQNILALRRALETDGDGRVRIETVPRRGYRFLAEVEEELAGPRALHVPTPAPSARAPLDSAGLASRRTRVPSLRAAAVLCGLAILAAGAVWKLTHSSRPIPGVRSIAVLPLTTLGAAGADGYLGLGLADAVTTRLGYVRSLLVRPTASILALDGRSRDPVAAGRALRVDAVLAGQIQKFNGRIRVTAQLIGVRDGVELWSEKFDVKAGDLFTIEDSISESVARALTSSLSAGETERVGRDRRTSPDVYETYLRGRYFWNQRTEPATRKARDLFRRAIALDPGYAPAYAGLADALHYFPDRDYDPRRARELAERALALDDTLAEAYASLGNLSLFTDWKVDEAEAYFRRALDLNPSYATAHQWYGYCFLVRGDLAGANREIRRARETDPLSLPIGVDAGLMLYYARRYDAAAAEERGVLDLDPTFAQARQGLLFALLQKGDLGAARQACSPPSRMDTAPADSCLALVAAYAGDKGEAEARLVAVTGPERWWTEAAVALELGDSDGAMAILEKAYGFHSTSLLLIGADPLFDGLRSDRRFVDLMNRIGIRPVSS